MSRVRSAFIFLTALCAALFFVAPFAHAESVVWSSSGIPQLYAVFDNGVHFNINGTTASVAYNARALLVNENGTTEPLACGSTVPAGSKVAFEFVSHANEDINWFTSGYANDSPYGFWKPNAARPTEADCASPYYVTTSQNGHDLFVSLSIDPPSESITGTNGCSPWNGSSINQVCTLTQPGVVSANFMFASTIGHFYESEAWNGCYEHMGGAAMLYDTSSQEGQTYALPVPAQNLSCPITVAAPIGLPPGQPTLAASSASGANSCTTGSPYSIQMSATDPDNDNIRYLVDWNGDGTVDQVIPATGYVASGSTQTASRIYSIAGSKTIKVRAQDVNGNNSSWATLSFNCAAGSIDTGNGGLNGGLGNGDNGSGLAGPDLSLRVVPSLVPKGTSTKVNWSASNVKSCTVSGQNGDGWTGLESIIGGEVSGPITQSTQYTLTCIDLANGVQQTTATVNILPVFVEQ